MPFRAGIPNWQLLALGGSAAIGLVYLLQLTYAYLSIYQQIVLGWAGCALILLTFRLRASKRQPWRLLFMALAAFMALRYIQWRTFDTLLYTGPLDFLGMALVYIAELYGLAIYLMGMFVNTWPLDTPIIPLPADTSGLPTVDVLIPTYNESEEIVRITVTAAKQINYPADKLRVYILDDGGTLAKRNHPENGEAAWERHYSLRRLADTLGVGYLTRETNQQAKAGNINHALQYTDGELVLLLDCDHVPTHDILQNTVGQFLADPKLFLVQTPHFFINPTPVEKNLEGRARPMYESDMFYRGIHPALNFWNASYFCGSAAVLRRSCLMEVGGICGTTITEDAETAFRLHSRGYNSVYINRPMVCGLSPEVYDDYLVQHSRWAQGMVQLVLLNNPLTTPGLTFAQRIAYFNCSFFWLFAFPRSIYFVAPACYLVFGINVYHASWLQILAYTLPYVFSIHLVLDFLYAGSRQPFFSAIYESVQTLFLIPPIAAVLFNPWKPTFIVTPKQMTTERNYLSPLAAPFFLVIAFNVLAVILAGIKWYAQPIVRDVIAVTVVWSFYNLYLSVVALGAFWERRQVRRHYRIPATGKVIAYFPHMAASFEGMTRDVSLTGMAVEMTLPFVPREGDRVEFTVTDSYNRQYRFENRLHHPVVRAGHYFCGSEFLFEHVAYADVVSYVFGDSLRWQEEWERKSHTHGTPRMLWFFLRTGVAGFVSGCLPVFRNMAVRLWQLLVKWTTSSELRDRLLWIISWSVYYLYLSLASLVAFVEQRSGRKLQRVSNHGAATLYFPRMDATLLGSLEDVSLTGAGLFATAPFAINEQEHATLHVTAPDGKAYHFPCKIKRYMRREDKMLIGAEFVVDIFNYPAIVRFVYGGSGDMLRALLAPQGIAAQGGVAVAAVSRHIGRAIRRLLAYAFLNPKMRTDQE